MYKKYKGKITPELEWTPPFKNTLTLTVSCGLIVVMCMFPEMFDPLSEYIELPVISQTIINIIKYIAGFGMVMFAYLENKNKIDMEYNSELVQKNGILYRISKISG